MNEQKKARIKTEQGLLKSYVAKARSWEVDINGSLRRSRNLAWGISLVSIIVTVFLAISMMLLMPLKEFSPYVIRVDNNTGYIDILQDYAPGTLSEDETITRFFLARHVLARETYDPSDLKQQFNYVIKTSAETAREKHKSLYSNSNADSPANLYGYNNTIEAQIISVSFLNERTASVRFKTKLLDKRAQNVEETLWVAIVTFRYVQKPQRFQDSIVNPLGFQVIGYRKDQEVVGG